MRSSLFCAFFCLLLLLGSWVYAADADETFDLTLIDDYQPIELEVEKITGLYAHPTLSSHLRNLTPAMKVKLIGYRAEALLVTSDSPRLRGWVAAEALTPIKPDTISELRARYKEQIEFDKAIKEKRVIAGMSQNQVQEALGKPNKRSSRSDENGTFEIWSYVKYEREVDYTTVNRVVQNSDGSQRVVPTVHRDVEYREVGAINIEFKNGLVAAVEETISEPTQRLDSTTKRRLSP